MHALCIDGLQVNEMRVQVHVKTEETERLQAAVEHARISTKHEPLVDTHRLREHDDYEHDDLTNGHSGESEGSNVESKGIIDSSRTHDR